MKQFEKKSPQDSGLPEADHVAITLRADIRRREQDLRIRSLNIGEEPGVTDAMKQAHTRLRGRLDTEMAGKWEAANHTPQDLHEQAIALEARAAAQKQTSPIVAVNSLAQSVKLNFLAGKNISEDLHVVRSEIAAVRNIRITSPLGLLPDATVLGLQRRLTEQTEVPAAQRIAHALRAHNAHELFRDYALVLPESNREKFIEMQPESERQRVSADLDESVSTVLHGAQISETNKEDQVQRRAVRARVYNELRRAVEDGSASDTRLVAVLSRAMIHLGDDVKNLLLEIARDEYERRGALEARADFLPAIMGVLLKQFDDFRANDLSLKLIGDPRTPPKFAASLFRKIVKNNYLDSKLGEWWDREDQSRRLEILQVVAGQLGVVPSVEVVKYIGDDRQWAGVPLVARAAEVKKQEVRFAQTKTQKELVSVLQQDDRSAMTYFLLHGGEDRFNLINNYSFEKFKEMIGLINDLKEHAAPITQFTRALERGGISQTKTKEILTHLRTGEFPGDDKTADHQIASFDVSENARVKNANAEIGRVLGSAQLGVVLRVPMYRDYLKGDVTPVGISTAEALDNAQTFEERSAVLNKIDELFPDFKKRAVQDLEENWKALGEKMVLGITLENVFDSNEVSIRGEELLPRLNSKRFDLKQMKKSLLVSLKTENKDVARLRDDINSKRKARQKMNEGLAHQTDPARRVELEQKISQITKQLEALEAEREALSKMKVSDRFEHLSPEDRAREIEKLGKEIVALTEKSPSAIFTYLTMQVVGEERMTEQDVELIKELESHLQGPFQTIVDAQNYESKSSNVKKRQSVSMQWLDKRARLASMVRFADSKICCFSSSNYEMRVQHDTPNKYWVASINADPMSFVIALEQPQDVSEAAHARRVHENEGFIFGSFAVDEAGDLAVMLNGLYYAPGIEDGKQVSAMLEGVERMLGGLPVKTIAIAAQHGGSVKMPEEYQQKSITLTRLRALDSGEGRPEDKIYDDLGTGSDLNKSHNYQLWCKKIIR